MGRFFDFAGAQDGGFGRGLLGASLALPASQGLKAVFGPSLAL